MKIFRLAAATAVLTMAGGGCTGPQTSAPPSQLAALPTESNPNVIGQPPAAAWELVPLPDLPGVQLNDIAHTKRGWVAVGGPIPNDVGTSGDPPKGVVLFSANGADWARVDAPDLVSASGIDAVAAALDGGFVAVGSAHGFAAIWHSPDGMVWSLGEPAIDFGQATIFDVTGVMGGFVAVGSLDRGGMQLPGAWHSTDGQGWVASGPIGHEPGGFRTILATTDGMIAGGSAQFDASAPASAQLWHSSDGQQWIPVSLSDSRPSGWVAGLATTPSGFVAVGSAVEPTSAAAVWLSSDGGSWQPGSVDLALEPIPGMEQEEMDDVASIGHALLGVGGPPCCAAPPSAWLSVDGSHWVRVGLENLAGHLSAVSADGATALVVGYRGLAAAIWRISLAD